MQNFLTNSQPVKDTFAKRILKLHYSKWNVPVNAATRKKELCISSLPHMKSMQAKNIKSNTLGTFWKSKCNILRYFLKDKTTRQLCSVANHKSNSEPSFKFLKIIHRGLPLLPKITYNKLLCWNQNSKLFKPGGNGTHTKSYKLTHRKYVNCNAKIAMPSLS